MVAMQRYLTKIRKKILDDRNSFLCTSTCCGFCSPWGEFQLRCPALPCKQTRRQTFGYFSSPQMTPSRYSQVVLFVRKAAVIVNSSSLSLCVSPLSSLSSSSLAGINEDVSVLDVSGSLSENNQSTNVIQLFLCVCELCECERGFSRQWSGGGDGSVDQRLR